MTLGLIHGLEPPVIGFPVRVCHQSLHRFKGKMSFPSCIASSGLMSLGFGSFFSLTLQPVRFQLGFDGYCHPSSFQVSHHPPKACGDVFLGSRVSINTFSASLKGFQVQHCSFAALFASFEG